MRDRDSTPVKDRRGGRYDDVEENDSEKVRDSSRHRSKERSKDSQGEERARTRGSDVSKDRERERDRKKEDKDGREKDRSKDKRREKDHDREKDLSHKDRKDQSKERGHDRADKDSLRDREKDREREKSRTREKERDKERDREKDHEREKGKDKHKDRERERERESDKERHRDSLDREKEKGRNKGKEVDKDDRRSRDKDRASRKHRDESRDMGEEERKDDMLLDREEGEVVDTGKDVNGSSRDEEDNRYREHQQNAPGKSTEQHVSASELEKRISKMKEERRHKQPAGDSDILSWVSKSRKLEEKRNSAKEKALRLSKVFEEQDDINQGEFEVDTATKHSSRDLAGVKVLHGLDKVIEGGAVVLTLKDQGILADGELNEEVDVLENIEIGEQKRRDEAYQAAKKKAGSYEDKFNEDPGFQKKMLPQYDDPAMDEGITLDASGRFTGDAEKKLEELRKRIQGVPSNNYFEDLSSSEKVISDYYTPEEMLKFKKPKKKKSLRKKDKLDLDALEAEAVSAGLGVGDLGSRNSSKREAIRDEQERLDAEMRSKSYQAAYAKADVATKALRGEQSRNVTAEEEESSVFGDDDEELRKSLERARKVALKKQDEVKVSGPEAIAHLASSTASEPTADDQTLASGEMQENKVVFTEMEEFVGGLQLDEESHKPDGEDVFMEEDLAPTLSDQEMKDEDGGWTEVKNSDQEEPPAHVDETEDIVPDETIHEAPVGKGLSGALKMLKDRGTLKETIEWGGRNMDKKKSKLLGIHEHGDGQKEIRLERTDEYGRILTPKEAFRLLSHKFHGKGPGKMKQEKRMRQYEEELKVKRMKNSDTPSQSVDRMREAQAQLKTPYLVLSGNVKPGQTSDPTSGFATVDKDLPGGLTPMLGDRKVEHFLGIKRKSKPGNMGPPPPRKPEPKP